MGVWVHTPGFYHGIRGINTERYYQVKSGRDDLYIVDVRQFFAYLQRRVPEYYQWLWTPSTALRILKPGGYRILSNRKKLIDQHLLRRFFAAAEGCFHADKLERAAIYAGDHDELWVNGEISRPMSMPPLEYFGRHDTMTLEEWVTNRPDWYLCPCPREISYTTFEELCQLVVADVWQLTKGGRSA